MVAAPIVPGHEVELRKLLLTMNRLPGAADPDNPLVAFGAFDTLHFARFVILNDSTLDDLKAYGPDAEFPNAPIYLAFLGDCDGPADKLLTDFAARYGAGLRQIFSHCADFDENGDLLQWMRSHSLKPAANYVNWIGRTVLQIHEEAALHKALSSYLKNLSADDPPQQLHRALVRAVRENGPPLTPEAPTPISWQTRRLTYILAAALALFVVLFPILALGTCKALLVYGVAGFIFIAALTAFVVELRRRETSGPDISTPPTDVHLAALGALQDYDVTNQYSVIGSSKPGRFPRWMTTLIWWAIDAASPILYPRGNLARVKTIHFAHWFFLDDKRRGVFVSNYDGSAESYMDDFVNKVSFGLNLAFSQWVSYPRTRFLFWGGAEREQEFKNTQRRHALPTEVWYKAYRGLTLADIQRNARIREGLMPKRRFWQILKPKSLSDAEIRRWLSEI